jgi:hypothetical protein
MERLLQVRCVAVRVTHISIFSGRYGLRRSSSYLVLRPPDGGDQQVMLPLPELERPATLTQAAVRQRRGLQRDDFFVGSQSLQQVRATHFPLRVTDAAVWQWLRAAEQTGGGPGDGLLRLDLFGHLTPRRHIASQSAPSSANLTRAYVAVRGRFASAVRGFRWLACSPLRAWTPLSSQTCLQRNPLSQR